MSDGPAVRRVAKLTDIWKSYGAVPVLKGVSLTLQAGEVHALLGGNGAGKSSLMKIMSGVIPANSGAIEINGEALAHASPAAAQELGLYLVPQEAHILPNQSVLENISLGLTASPRALRSRIEQLVSELSVSLDLDAQAATLEIAERQIVEVLRGLVRDARVLILDEPTSALTPFETSALFQRVRKLQAQGVGIFFISHKLREIREICSRISVLRDGVIVLSGALDGYSDAQIIDAMSRVQITEMPGKDRTARKISQIGKPRLSVRGLSGEGFRNISLDVRAGEILGLAGVVGAGRTEFAETLFGLRPQMTGSVVFDGADLKRRSPRVCIDHGLVYLPEDRQQHGLFLEAPLFWNVSSYLVHRLPFFLRPGAERKSFNQFRSSMGIKCADPGQEARSLSGGNQQKVLLAKCLSVRPKVLILDEPTRGVDVAARNDIYDLIRKLAADGVAIVLISSDFDEIEQLADRVEVMAFGQSGGELTDNISVDSIARLAFGASEARHA
ncbi:autoinducer 2 ABC transporter ATP-binding protein LsrA [Nitratireductor indicus]|uniref:Autoinducer 2 import ATP-binding protein LsrA n=1 Tax=Nitratireductor indicus C115 TaxID=1231190 RepID=K2NV94_9HYPH|nr:autoinducer 2 ABC transporter ATP-binding protein LsrA [Nitratireductor indicus]EKF43245.1 autoinducer 2 ABC transporter ATP-binding protein LsrA [Nitratireductor indicus C115]MDS1137798.1 autoinducer 2 ABC transporter ATP-binding protein LsrA [Nitratireductor indicus]SFQ54046.1 AI-2 transport system ATP-binding protein [Nitratireductor indicus]